MSETIQKYTQWIKEKALEIGFSACGVCKAAPVDNIEREKFETWIKQGLHSDLHYLERNSEKRFDPTLLVDNAKSIICVALNYFPKKKLSEDVPQFAYYAYGNDYHDVVKKKLTILFEHIQTFLPNVSGRCFTDSAPVLESYWAMQAGIGFKGKNSLLIIPQKGSFYFLGELIINQPLDYDLPQEKSFCGTCRKCIEACPTGALQENGCLNVSNCISYQTIENKSETIAENVASKLDSRIYGCDVCQQVCPWNRYAEPHSIAEFIPSEEFLNLTSEDILSMSEENFQRIFKYSAVKRAKYKGLQRNCKAILP